MNIFEINNLIKHNLKIYEEFLNYINNLNIIILNKPSYKNRKYYFSIEINEDIFSISSIYDSKNNTKIEIIGIDNNNLIGILGIFNNTNNIIEYFKLNYNVFSLDNNYIRDETQIIYGFSSYNKIIYFEENITKNNLDAILSSEINIEDPFEELNNKDPFEELNNNEDSFEELNNNDDPFEELNNNDDPFEELNNNEDSFEELNNNDDPFEELNNDENQSKEDYSFKELN